MNRSSDGFIAGPHDEVDGSLRLGIDEMAERVMKEIGAVVLSNRRFGTGPIELERTEVVSTAQLTSLRFRLVQGG